jgi:hypothetical protein
MKSLFVIDKIGYARIPSPIKLGYDPNDGIYNYLRDEDRILYDKELSQLQKTLKKGDSPVTFEKAGPREFIF